MAERIWEPGLASIAGSCGLTFTALDNTHFQSAGLEDKQIWGSYITDDQGITLRVLPIDYQLRYLIPFHEPQETIDYINSLKECGVSAVTYADDGEKFGVWPGTKKWVYGEEWLERFFNMLEENSHWIDIILPGNYVKSEPPLGRVYLPTASYKEMMEWALPVEAQKKIQSAENQIEGDSRFNDLKPYIRGGFWRNFLTKYPESDNMYRRMLMVSSIVETVRDKTSYENAARELYMAQCNCAYWHGVFGGLYLNFLRRAIYEHLIKAERFVSNSKAEIAVTDFNSDGYDEVIMENEAMKLFISPQQSGSIFELDYYPKAFNLFDTLTRREEVYHSQIENSKGNSEEEHSSIHNGIRSKEKDIFEYLNYDWYRRLNFLDHFMPIGQDLGTFSKAHYTELGDFINNSYKILKINEIHGLSVLLAREGYIRVGGREIPVKVGKKFSIPEEDALLKANYDVELESGNEVLFGVEMNLGLQSGHSDDSFIEIPGQQLSNAHLASTGEEKKVSKVILTIGWMPLKVTISFSKPATLWWFPIETVSLSEGGLERNYQNTCMVPIWKINGADGHFNIEIEMVVE